MLINPGAGGGLAAVNFSAGATSQNLSALTFDNAGGVSFGLAGSVITAVAGTAAPSPVNFTAGTASGNLGTVLFADSNSVHFGLSGSTITASVDLTQGFIGVVIGAATATPGANGYFELVPTGMVTMQVAALGNPPTIEIGADNGLGLNTAATNVTWTVNSSGISLNAAGYAGVGETVGTIAGTDLALTVNTAGVSIGYPKWITTAAAAVPIGTAVKAVASVGSTGTITRYAPEDHQHAGVAAFAVTNTGNTLGDTRSQVGTLFIAASGAVTASQSTGAGGNDTVWISVAAQTVQSQNFVAVIASGANGNGTFTSGTLSVKAGNNITLSTGANVFSIHGEAAQSVQTQNLEVVIVSGANGNATFSSGTYSVKAGNNITLSTGANVYSIHGATAAGDGGIFAGAAGTTQTAGTVVWSNSNNVSFGMNASTITATATFAQTNQSVGLYATGNTTNNSSTTFDARTLGTWNALGAMTVGYSNGSIQLSAPATSSLVGTFGLTVSTAGSTLSVQPALMSEFHPFRLDNALITNSTFGQSSLYFVPMDIAWPVSASRINVFVSIGNVFSGAPNNSTAWIALGYGMYTRMTGTGSDRMSLLTSYSMSLLSGSVSSSTRLSLTYYSGLSDVTSHSTTSYQQNNASVPTFLSDSIGGYRAVAMPVNLTLTPGRYWVGFSNQTASQGASFILGMSFGQVLLSNFIAYRPFGSSSAASNASYYVPIIGAGSYSAQSAAWPVSIALTTDAIRAATSPVVPMFNFSGIAYASNVP